MRFLALLTLSATLIASVFCAPVAQNGDNTKLENPFTDLADLVEQNIDGLNEALREDKEDILDELKDMDIPTDDTDLTAKEIIELIRLEAAEFDKLPEKAQEEIRKKIADDLDEFEDELTDD